ncbi:MAG TPA: ATP-binding protein, partial [Salinivirga sp.]
IRTALRNIISNAIKYNKSNGKLKIEVYKKNGHTFLIIEDTGIGMDKFTIEQLFTYSNSHKLKGTLGESSSGIGLFLTRDFLEKNNIIVDVQSNPEKGTKFELTL